MTETLPSKKLLWVVLDERGAPEHVASTAQECHDHINYAIDVCGDPDAGEWVVRAFESATGPTHEPATAPCPNCAGSGFVTMDFDGHPCGPCKGEGAVAVHEPCAPQFAGWLNRASDEFIDVQQRPSKPVNWVPVYFAPSIEELERRAAPPPATCPGHYHVAARNVCTMFPHCRCSPEARAADDAERKRAAESTAQPPSPALCPYCHLDPSKVACHNCPAETKGASHE